MKKKAILCRHFKKYSYFCTDSIKTTEAISIQENYKEERL